MNFRQRYQQLIFLVIGCMLLLAANTPAEDELREKHIKVVMRMIGHKVLTCLGDEQSRILPIEKIDRQYKIPFEFEFGFDPEEVVSIVVEVMKENNLATGYLVEVEQCETKEVVHSFMVRDAMNFSMLPCSGRMLPKDCYNLLMTLLEEEKSSSEASIKPSTTQKRLPLKWAVFMLPVLVLIGFISYFGKKKNPSLSDGQTPTSDPDLILIGDYQFDKRSMTLSKGKDKVELSGKEAELLTFLYAHANIPVEREVILQKVWGDEGDYVGRTLDVFISRLRKKLKGNSSVKIVNIRGVGYKLVEDLPK